MDMVDLLRFTKHIPPDSRIRVLAIEIRYEAYCSVLNRLYPKIHYLTLDTFHTKMYAIRDDVDAFENAYDVLLFGGNEHDFKALVPWMRLHNVPSYAFLTLPSNPALTSAKDVRWLHAFDHVFVETKSDLFFAVQQLGHDNVSFIPNLIFMMPNSSTKLTKPPSHLISIALCLTKDVSIADMVELLSQIDKVFLSRVYLVANGDSDEMFPKRLAALHQARHGLINTQLFPSKNSADWESTLTNMDLIVGSSYIAILHAIVLEKPFVALCENCKKLQHLLQDLKLSKFASYSIKNIWEVLSDVFDTSNSLSWKHSLVQQFVSTPSSDFKPRTLCIATRRCPRQYTRCWIRHLMTHRLMGIISRRKRKVLNQRVLLQASLHSPSLTENEKARFIRAVRGMMPDASRDELGRLIAYFGTGGHITDAYAAKLASAPWTTADDPTVLSLLDVIRKDHISRQMAVIRKMTQNDVIRIPTELYPLNCRLSINLHAFCQQDHSHFQAGWSKVFDSLHVYDATLLNKKPSVLVDTYVDRTFHWAASVLQADGVLPYQLPWVGFVRHTFSSACKDISCKKLFESPLWRSSLHTCKALVSFSRHQAQQIRDALQEIGHGSIGVHVVHFPTTLPEKTFSYSRFSRQPRKRLVMIGRWLRDTSAMYMLKVPATYHKTIVFRDHDDDTYLAAYSKHQENENKATPFRRKSYIESTDGGVDVWSQVSAQKVNELLTQSIVFLKLFDVAVCHTVIQCIVFHTPLIIGRHPVLEEWLGRWYPGFYDTLEQASSILNSPSRLYSIHIYLRYMVSKHAFTINQFLKDIGHVLQTVNMHIAL